jgi:hypothetical protein
VTAAAELAGGRLHYQGPPLLGLQAAARSFDGR